MFQRSAQQEQADKAYIQNGISSQKSFYKVI